jgi:peptidoglycan/xylan/chitin deacetylase (PgdA/CDA1 family)
MTARFFIRNDDVWRLDQEFCFFFDLAIEHDLPVVYAVIPGKMDKSLTRFLCRAKEKTPRLLDIVQHGWLHADHSVDAGTKYEFGRSRAYGIQREDIRQGLKKMRLAFGEHFTPAFVPPYHGYDERTLRVLHEEDFQIFSAGTPRREVKKHFMEIPAQVSFSRYEGGRTSIHQARDVVGILARGIHRRPLSGVVTHHADFATAALRKELKIFFNCLASLEDKEGWRTLLFSDILSGTKGE